MKATIYSYSVLFSSSIDFQDKVPYAVAILEREDSERFASFLHGYTPETPIAINQEVYQLPIGENGETVFSLVK